MHVEIKCGIDLNRTDIGVKTWDKLFIQKVINSQDLSDNTSSLTVSNYMGHQIYHVLTVID